MTRSVFPFVIGYQGWTAIVDRGQHLRWCNASTEKLVEAGLYKAAFARAVWDQDKDTMEKVLEAYNSRTPRPYPSVEVFQKAFGVYPIPAGVKRILFL